MKKAPKSTTRSKPAELYYGIPADDGAVFGPTPLEELVSDIRNNYGDSGVERAIIFPVSSGKRVKQTITLVLTSETREGG